MPFSLHERSAAGRTLRPLQSAEQHPYGRHVCVVPTPLYNRLHDHHQPKVQSATKASGTFPSRNLQGVPLWKRRYSSPLSPASRSGHLKRSLSAFWWTGQRRSRWSLRGILVQIMDTMTVHRRKSPAERISSTARTHPSRVASTTKKVQGDEYLNVEGILEWR